jgi:hypothetical protein
MIEKVQKSRRPMRISGLLNIDKKNSNSPTPGRYLRNPSATISAMSFTLVWAECLSFSPSSNMVRQ